MGAARPVARSSSPKNWQSTKGRNPFDDFTVGEDKTKMSSIVKAYDPAGSTSQDVYQTIKNKLADWVEEAIAIREAH